MDSHWIQGYKRKKPWVARGRDREERTFGKAGYEPKALRMEFFRRRLATEAELEEGRRQIEESERRLARQGLEMVWGERPGGGERAEESAFRTPNPRQTLAVEDEMEWLGGQAEKREEDGVQSEETELREEGRGPEGSQQEKAKEPELGSCEIVPPTLEESPTMPLFNEEQIRRLEQLEMSAPLLMRAEPQIPRPRWMVEEEKKAEDAKRELEKLKEMREQQRMAAVLRDEHQAKMIERMMRLEKENQEVKSAWKEMQAENLKMKEKLKLLSESPVYETPKEELPWREESKKGGEDEKNKGGFETPRPRRTGPGEPRGLNEISMELMVKMMDSMQKMMNKKNSSPEVETVRYGQSEIPKLPEWSVDSAPLDLGDWLLMLDPVMGDLSPTSHLWWQMLMEEARKWYERHQTLSPLDRVSHRPSPSDELAGMKWMRLERRASSLLLAAIPEGQREEMVATKNLTPLSMITKLMTIYQPGGLSEKSIILKALEQPPEATCLASALVGLRRWLRWKRRAAEVQVALPDPSVLVKGLNKLVKKVLDSNKELGFRINLAKSTLMVESIPREETVHKLAEHLVAEVEAIAHLEVRGGKGEKQEVVKHVLKKFEEGKGGEKGGAKGFGSPEKTSSTCRFFISEYGCKKGKQCQFAHILDDQKRCWNCGSTQHYAPKCDRPREAEGKGGGKGEGKSEGKVSKVTKKEESPKKEPETSGQEDGTTETMKELLEEANKMLKTISTPKRGDGDRDVKLEKLQKQLDDLRSLKVFRVARIEVNEEEGLIDSGATHSLRGWRRSDRHKRLKDIQVTLAGGRTMPLQMTVGGTMISEDPNTEPIVPMGKMISRLGCTLGWTQEDGLIINHPSKGVINTKSRNGCPYVEKTAALELIEELDSVGEDEAEEEEDQEVKRIQRLDEQEEDWIRDFVNTHPVLKDIPKRLRQELIRRPATTTAGIPGANKRRRKLWQKKGLVLHLYSGEDSGFTLERALKEAGGDVRLLLEVDIKNGKEFDMTKDELYERLLRLAMDGVIDGVVGGPNCRTRSFLRHIPKPNAPRPVRDWNGGKWGSKRNTIEEDQKVFEDDILMWRLWMIALVAIHVRRAQDGDKGEVKVLVEQPAEPSSFPQVVSFWRTEEWKKLVEIYDLKEMTFLQGDWEGKSPKPTTVGGNLRLRSPKGGSAEERKHQPVKDSKELERWAPGMMREIARSIFLQVQGGDEEGKMMKLSWDEHLRLGHLPFRRDCWICQQSRQKQNPHRRKKFPLSGVLSLDTAGPYRDGTDLVMTSRYLCVGAFTWAFPKGTRGFEEPTEVDVEGAPLVEEWKDGRKKEEDGEKDERDEEISPREGPHDGERDEEISPRAGPHDGERGEETSPRSGPCERELEDEGEEEEEWEIKVFRMAAPLATKKSEEVLGVVMEFVLRLRADGFWVSQIHTDQGHEYYGPLKKWCLKRGIMVTRTPGDDPQGNGRAEVAIQGITQQMRAALLQAEVGWEWWPLAARHVAERLRSVRIGEEPQFPNFLEEVLVRKRHWRRGVLLEPTCEKVKYLCPAWDHHGHWVLKEDNTKVVARYFLRRLTHAVTEATWIALDVELEDGLATRRRLREKTHPMVRKVEEEEKRGGDEMRIAKIIEEEMVLLLEDEEEIVKEELKVIRKLRKMVETPWEEEEVLQTKIVSPQEVHRNWEFWKEAARSEIESLLFEKEALEEITKEEFEKKKQMAGQLGKKVEVIPSKVVFTRKPGPRGGKPKVRWVVCGNFEEKKDDEENFSSGADATAFRVLVWLSAQRQWEGMTVDVKTAFLNAEWNEEDQDTVVVVKPPSIFVEHEALKSGCFYVPRKAVYGFRRSPRLWGMCRDEAMEAMDIVYKRVENEKETEEVMKLKQLESEPNLWKVVPRDESSDGGERVEGMIMTYVDDLFLVGSSGVVKALMTEIQKKWKTSAPEVVSQDPVRFLGMDISKKMEEGGEEVWIITQKSYVTDLLVKEGREWKKKKIPIGKELAAELLEVEETPTADQIKKAQKAVGELLWLLTRSRPDLMYVMARMCSQVSKCPVRVLEVAGQVKGYLKSTAGHGLRFKKSEEDEVVMRVFTDASFSPDGSESHGCVVVLLGAAPISWKSGRQSMVTLSTAESELREVVEGFALGEATAVLVEEVVNEMIRTAFTDSQAAQAVMLNEGGSWRTRHLRMRAAFARQLIQKGIWSLNHVPGEHMIADLGTKPLSSVRMTKLKEDLGMVHEVEGEAEEEEEKSRKDGAQWTAAIPEEVKKVLQLVAVAAQIRGAKGQGAERGEEEGLWWLMVIFLLSMVGLWNLMRWVFRLVRRGLAQPEEEPGLSERRGEGSSQGGLRRRVSGERRGGSSGSERSHFTPRGSPSPRTPARSTSSQAVPDLLDDVRTLLRRVEEQSQEPGEEPGTWTEDFVRGPIIIEEVQHPEDWDPEVHGDIPSGKGSPPESYFRRMEGKGGRHPKGKGKG